MDIEAVSERQSQIFPRTRTGRKREDEILPRADCIDMEQEFQKIKKEEEKTWKKKGCSWESQEERNSGLKN